MIEFRIGLTAAIGMRRRGWLFALLIGLVSALPGCGGHAPPKLLSGAACLSRLDAQAISYRPLVSVPASRSSCEIDTAVRVTRIAANLSQPAVMSCALAARLDDFERDVVQPAAKEEFGERVVRISHMGSFACRGVNGGSRLSMHALGLAIDIAGFRLADGSTVSVKNDWRDGGAKGAFLRQVARRACKYFSVVLTPASNAAHYDHIHLDIGPDKLCEA